MYNFVSCAGTPILRKGGAEVNKIKNTITVETAIDEFWEFPITITQKIIGLFPALPQYTGTPCWRDGRYGTRPVRKEGKEIQEK